MTKCIRVNSMPINTDSLLISYVFFSIIFERQSQIPGLFGSLRFNSMHRFKYSHQKCQMGKNQKMDVLQVCIVTLLHRENYIIHVRIRICIHITTNKTFCTGNTLQLLIIFMMKKNMAASSYWQFLETTYTHMWEFSGLVKYRWLIYI